MFWDQQQGNGRVLETDRVSRSTALARIDTDRHAGENAGHGIQTLTRQTMHTDFPGAQELKVEVDVGWDPRP